MTLKFNLRGTNSQIFSDQKGIKLLNYCDALLK